MILKSFNDIKKYMEIQNDEIDNHIIESIPVDGSSVGEDGKDVLDQEE